tara:strand:+ start:664 stop:1215 length:552 start_codon:yes stop_codon:yes gene_type:complete
MRLLIERILKPNFVILLLYGLISLVCLTAYIWRFSFVWEFVFSVTHYIIGLLIVIVIGLVFARVIDKKFNLRLKKYFLVSIIQLLIIWTISNPIRTWQIESSLEKARLIIEPLKTYKEQFGIYPQSLVKLGKTLEQDIPTRTNIGTRYWYEVDNEQDYRLWFVSYYGYTAYYNNEKDDWIITD